MRRIGEDAALPEAQRRPALAVRKPSDLPDIILREVVARSFLFTTAGGVQKELRTALTAVFDDPTQVNDMVGHIAKIMERVLLEGSVAMLGTDEATATAIRAAERPLP